MASSLKQRPPLDSILSLVSLVDRHIQRLLSDPLARNSLHRQCTSNLTPCVTTTPPSEFSDHSALSNLYRGIRSLELAIKSKNPDEWAARVASSEKMLQVPALLDEEGATQGVPNRYVLCCTYFYLCLVRKMKGDQWQMTMHFLQAVLACPGAVKSGLAPELWRGLFRCRTTEEEARRSARRCKDWLMYYQVVSYGEAPPWTTTTEESMKNCQ